MTTEGRKSFRPRSYTATFLRYSRRRIANGRIIVVRRDLCTGESRYHERFWEPA
jgi:hypothetical protein